MGFESLRGSHILPAVEAVAAFHRHLAALDPDAPPAARLVCGPTLEKTRRLVALPGSFNPPHRAHFALLAAARTAWDADAGAFVLSARTVDKERVTGMWLEDRLWLMCQLVGDAAAMLVTNRGLYTDMALALRALCPALEALAFVTGCDKIVQIFDPRYYDDRDRALDQLFGVASFLVAPRGRSTANDVAALLDRPENRRYARRVTVLELPGELADVSSTSARIQGDLSDVPALAAALIRETGCYLNPPPAEYAARGAAIRAAAAARNP